MPAAPERGEAWPHLQQVCRVERRRTVKGQMQVAVSYAVTSLPPTAAGVERLLQILRERWHIENRVQDVTFDEDRSQIRTASAPPVDGSVTQPDNHLGAVGGSQQHSRCPAPSRCSPLRSLGPVGYCM